MKRALIVLALIALIFISLGFLMGWFQFSSGNQDNKPTITFSVDRDKLESDKDKAVDAVQDFGQQAKDKATGTTPKADDQPIASEQPPQTQE